MTKCSDANSGRVGRNLPVFPSTRRACGREASGKVLNVLAQNIPWFSWLGDLDHRPNTFDLRRCRSFQGC